jgi:hypothetical protein
MKTISPTMTNNIIRPSLNFHGLMTRGILLLFLAYLPVEAMPLEKIPQVDISLKGEWRFSVDSGEQGTAGNWHVDAFDDSGWKTLVTGKSWEKQGVEHHGWGWFRRKFVAPKEFAGVPMMLELGANQSDDDVWINGVWVGGLHGPYKYKNVLKRIYAVPASAIRYGESNTIAVRVWGGNLWGGGVATEGLVEGNFTATFDPLYVSMRTPGGADLPAQIFDLTDAQQGKPFEIIFRFPADKTDAKSKLHCDLKDFAGGEIAALEAPVEHGQDGIASAAIKIGPDVAQAIYLSGRFKAVLTVEDGSGEKVYTATKELDHLSFARRDALSLPALADTSEETPYGKLKLVDEIDASLSIDKEIHPYLQSGFSHPQDFMTPGIPVNVSVNDILGKKARESATGWFAYRIGRGKLKAHSTYLLRIEYPEDKPRYCPIEINAGRTYQDVGWQNGVGPNDPYDPWPLSHAWQWYDTIVPLDGATTGTSGTYGASSENGFWVYFINKVTPGKYYTMYEGGPAVAHIKLYEIDVEKNAPQINRPSALPQRVLGFDWERQPEADPEDMARFAKLMGYNAVSPVIIKWAAANFSDPLNGYSTFGEDARKYVIMNDYKPGTDAGPVVTGKDFQHSRYLAATKRYGIQYIPRFEYGGSLDLPADVRAIGKDGKIAKPSRFNTWGCDILQPATWDDLQKLMDHFIKPYVKDNPQMTGALWRSREDRMQISYGKFDLELFARETNRLPGGSEGEQRAWASTGAGKSQYDDWWLNKRAEFHGKLAALMQSYRPDMKLYYYNWDGDKFGLILPCFTSWAFNKQIAVSRDGANFDKDGTGNGRAVYEKDRAERKKLTGQDYINVMRTGNFGAAGGGTNRADWALRPELYRDIKGVELLAPANFLCYADKPDYLNYFQDAEGLAVSNAVAYDEIGARTINSRYEGNFTTPAGSAFSMALELLAYFHGDARTLTYTSYIYGRGFADAHRRFAQAFLALPAIPGTVVDQGDQDVKVRTYSSANGTYVGVAHKGFSGKTLTVKLPVDGAATVTDLVTNQTVSANVTGNNLTFELKSGPMELNAFLVR